MPNDLVSKRTRIKFREAMISIWDRREILEAFGIEGVSFDSNYKPPFYVTHENMAPFEQIIMTYHAPRNSDGQLRTLVEQHYSTVDFTNMSSVERLLRVFAVVIDEATDLARRKGEQLSRKVSPESLKYFLSTDGFVFENGQIRSHFHRLPSVGWTSKLGADLDLPQIDRQISRITISLDSDPELAMGTAKELLESCCKTILMERAVDFNENDELSPLVSKVRQNLKLMPDDIDHSARGAKTMKRLLSNLGEITRGMSEVRNLYGTGHGKDGRSSSLHPRHAKLTVGAATTLAVFLYETHLETKETAP